MTTLFDVVFNGPLIGVSKRWPKTFHALEGKTMIRPWLDGKAYTAACGKAGLRIVAQDERGMIPWPPPHRMNSHERCRPCWLATGKPRIRARLKEDA